MTNNIIIQEIPTTHGKIIARVTLNVEKSLNSIDLSMIEMLYQHFSTWQHDENILCIWLEGAGDKAFCAGGDVRKLYESMQENSSVDKNYPETFFTQEYQLDYLIHTYPKPIICWGHGIVMGGGMGLMQGCQHRLVTEKSRLAMPEITIGLYPDVGGTWFLNRMPQHLGLFVGLTGASINALDAIYLGLADRFVPEADKDNILKAITTLNWSDDANEHNAQIHQTLKSFAYAANDCPITSVVKENENLLVSCVDYATLAEIYQAIQALPDDNKWLAKAKSALKNGSSTTAHLVFEQIKRGKHLSLKEVFMVELIISVQCTRHPDFVEGVRALLIDKDMQPNWKYKTIDTVPSEWVDAHFQSLWDHHPLSKM